jgi:hypothetical protein
MNSPNTSSEVEKAIKKLRNKISYKWYDLSEEIDAEWLLGEIDKLLNQMKGKEK